MNNVSSCPPGVAVSGMEPTVDTVAMQPIPVHWYYVLAGGGALLLLVIVTVVVILCCHQYHWARKTNHSVMYHSSQQLTRHGHRNCCQNQNPSYNLSHNPNHLYAGTGQPLEPMLTIRPEKDDSYDYQCWKLDMFFFSSFHFWVDSLFEVIKTHENWSIQYKHCSTCTAVPVANHWSNSLTTDSWQSELVTFEFTGRTDGLLTSDGRWGHEDNIIALQGNWHLRLKIKMKWIMMRLRRASQVGSRTNCAHCQPCNSMFSSVRVSALLWFAAWRLSASKYPVQQKRDLHTGTGR